MVRVLDLKSGGRRLKSHTDRLAGVVYRWTLEFFNSSVIIKMTKCLPPVGIFNLLSLVVIFFSFSLRWPNTVFKSLCLILDNFETIYALAPIFFARVKINYRSIHSRILTRVHAVAMATGLVKNKS